MTPEQFKNLLDNIIAQTALDVEEGREDYSEKLKTLREQALREYERECNR